MKVNTSKSKNAESFYIKQSYLDANGKSTSRTIRKLHDVYRALSVLAQESDLIQSEVYKNSNFLTKRNDHILYYDCTNYYFESPPPNRRHKFRDAKCARRTFMGGGASAFGRMKVYFEIEQEDGDKKYGKSKEHRPNPIIQMGLFTDGDGIPLAFSLFPENQNEQKSLKPLEQKVVGDFGCERFIFCSDAGLASESNRLLNHTANRAYIVTQSIKKLSNEYKELAPDRKGFRGLSDHKLVDLDQLTDKDCDQLFYKEEPYSTKKPEQRLLITYSPKYAAYQKEIREKQVERAASMLKSGNHKKTRKNPNDPARFIGKEAVTKDGEMADVLYYLDEEKIEQEARYDGLYAVCTDLFDDSPGEILNTLQTFEFADVQGQRFIPIYESTKLTDELHRSRGFESDYEFITKRKMREIQKLSKRKQI